MCLDRYGVYDTYRRLLYLLPKYSVLAAYITFESTLAAFKKNIHPVFFHQCLVARNPLYVVNACQLHAMVICHLMQ